MAKGRGSAALVSIPLILVLVVLLHSSLTEAVTYTVGDRNGWSFDIAGWTRGKRFLAGDTLVFNYDPSFHNVVSVDRLGYNTCSARPLARAYRSGKDQIKLGKGANFFICTMPGHCESGVKMTVIAL